MTEAQLFPLAPMNAAREAFKGILHEVEGAIEKRLENASESSASHDEDIAKLNAIVQDLRHELGELSFFTILLVLRLILDVLPQTKPGAILPTMPTKRGHSWTSSSRAKTLHVNPRPRRTWTPRQRRWRRSGYRVNATSLKRIVVISPRLR